MASYFAEHQTLMISLALLFAMLLASSLAFFGFRCCYPKLVRSHRLWDDIVLKAIYPPLQLFIWITGLSYALEASYFKQTFLVVNSMGMHLREFAAIVCLLWSLWRCVGYFELRITTQTPKALETYDKAKLLSFSRFVRVLIIALALIILLQASGIPVSGLLAFGGMGALVLGLAAKDLLANFFGGLLIYADRPFTVGDWISSPDKDIEGTVEAIGWRLSTIRRFDKRVLYIPNSIFSTITLENVSKMSHRRLLYIVKIRYSDLAVANSLCQKISTILAAHKKIDQQLTPSVKVDALCDSGIAIKIVAFSKELSGEDFAALQHAFLLQLAEAVKNAGADFASSAPTFLLTSPMKNIDAPTTILN